MLEKGLGLSRCVKRSWTPEKAPGNLEKLSKTTHTQVLNPLYGVKGILWTRRKNAQVKIVMKSSSIPSIEC